MRRALVLCMLMVIAVPAVSCPPTRSRIERTKFQRMHHCPVTDMPRGACPGYVVDHIKPLCAGGLDRVENMAWQTRADAAAKDRLERKLCRTKENYAGH